MSASAASDSSRVRAHGLSFAEADWGWLIFLLIIGVVATSIFDRLAVRTSRNLFAAIMRYEIARLALENGMTIEAAAAKYNLTPEDLMRSIADSEQAKEQWRRRLIPKTICVLCGQEIPDGLFHIEVGDEPYHNECYKKKFG